MAEEIEVPTEHLHEHMEHAAHHSGESWILLVALSSAILAVFAATASLLAGHHANEAVIAQIKASDQWGYYQAKGIKAAVLESRIDLLGNLGKQVPEKSREKLKEYRLEQQEIQKKAREEQATSESHLNHHKVLARSVTFFQVAIALGAISALTRRQSLWVGSIGLGLFGLLFFVLGIL
jgi:hypothetical protein